MSIRSTYKSLVAIASIVLLGSLTSSCEEKITDIGTGFLRDTLFTGTQTFDSNFTSSSRVKRSVSIGGAQFNLNYASPYLFFGSSADESIEAWPVLKIPFVHDSLGTIKKVDLVLSMPFRSVYGNATEKIEFSVYLETRKFITEGTSTLTLADLDPQPVATFTGSVTSDSTTKLILTLDSARLIPLLHTTTLAIVIVPGAGMTNVRAFSSNENGILLDKPRLELTLTKSGQDTSYLRTEYPTYDFHVISDKSTDQPGQFSIRGGYARRERMTFNIKEIRTRLSLDPYSTINSALLQLHLASSKLSTVPIDTAAPVLVEITTPLTEDSLEFLAVRGVKDPSSSDIYSFQFREFIEQAIRNNQDSLVLELRTGFALPVRVISGEGIGLEDYHLNRWTFYNRSATDPLKRPKLAITYSYLR